MSSSLHEYVDGPGTRERDRTPPVRDPRRNASPPPSIGSAVRRHPILVLLPTVLLLAAGIYVGHRKHPTYTASATINVGKSDINTQATPGYVQAAQSLASSYSRLVTSQHVTVPTARQLAESPAAVASHLTAVPIPNQPTFTISGTGTSSAASVTLVSAAVRSLQQFVQRSATQQGSAAQLLAKYRTAQAEADRLQLESSTLQARLNQHQPGATKADVAATKLAGQVASLRAQALSGSYLSLSQNGAAPTLDVLVDPTSASSDNRRTNMEKYGAIGAIAGLLIGLAFAALVGGIETRRRARASVA